MYQLIIKTHFDAAHALKNYQGLCENLHGHTYRVEVRVEGSSLNQSGMVCDFKELKKKIASVTKTVDHKNLSDIKPFSETSPSTENVARYFFESLEEILPSEVALKEVTVFESDDAAVSYRP